MSIVDALRQHAPDPGPAGQLPRRHRRPPAAAVLLAVLGVSVLASILIGSRPVPISVLWEVDHPLRAIAEARLDRTVLGVAVGAALGVAGACLQGLTRNPLGDPGILGISAGASFAMVLAMSVLGVSSIMGYVWFGFAGAAAAMLLVHGIAAFGQGGATPAKITIVGAALTAALASLTTAVLLVDRSTMQAFRYWQVGTIGGRDLGVLASMLPFLVVGFVAALAGARMLDTLALGNDMAVGLGERVVFARVVIGVAVILLAGGATALAGPIAFVGLIVPHAMRALAGPAYVRVLQLSAIGGAALVVAADTLGRLVLPPAEVQAGIMVALVGLPVFIALLRRSRWGNA